MPEPCAGGRQGQRVLVVAPNEDARSMLAFLLREEGFNVYTLADIPRARVLLTLCRGPVTVVMDESVPNDQRPRWFQMLGAVAQVRGVVVSQRPGVPWVGGSRWPGSGVPCVVVGQPLRIAALVEAITTVAARAERGRPDAVRNQRTPASQTGPGSTPAAPSRPA
ncbi:MAG TPA: hypothetical protein VIG30_08160 [Ktedonobacterales bacterium]